MGFSQLLQGKTSHEALLSLQDAEIRLLENIKRCFSFRVKCDREYAITLNTMCLQAQKTGLAQELSGSLVAEAWKAMVEETESLSRMIKQNADHIACMTLEKLNFLINEKRICRKMYADEHNRIETELSRLQDVVTKGKIEYEKCLDSFKMAKVKYEQLTKGKTNKKMEEVKEKYVKSCRKLHRVHNDYVLWLCEAAEYEKSFRITLLPSLLDSQQNLQEEMVEQCKTILTEYSIYTNLSNDHFHKLDGCMMDHIQLIIPTSEYKEFMNKNKSLPPLPVAFIFDRTLIDDYNGKLKPNVVSVDDLTFTFLKLKLAELNDKIKDCQAEIKEKQNQLVQSENELSSLRKSAEMAPTLYVKRKTLETMRYEILQLKSKEQNYHKQNELLAGSLSKIGEDGPPSALDLPIDTNTDTDTDLVNGDRVNVFFFFFFFLNKFFFYRIFSGRARFETRTIETLAPRVGRHFQQITFEELCRHVSKTLVVHPDLPLQDEDWFHGVLPREEVVRLLVRDGDYLVRETLRNDEQQIVLSVRWKGHKHFIVQVTVDTKYRFEGPSFPTIQELVSYQHRSKMPVTNKSGAILRQPIFRERWELNNDDVELVTKIGKGNFGDVYKARLKSNGQEIACKTCHLTLPDEQKKKFLQEGRILKQYDHPNIVKLIGMCVQKQPIMIVMELVLGGSLLNFVRNNGANLSVLQKLSMSIDCAAGMEYLESKNCIHRDLAARNCLIGKENIVKISDFGMSREEEEYVVSDGMKQIPIKWTAPEALNFGKYTSLCDVWSYGVLIWEIMSNGNSPYKGISNIKAREMIDSGYRMPAPVDTPDAVYHLMLRCWEYNCDVRPHFDEIHS
uniref:Tyrosine-protein kinase n=1 Tax=Strigamia maritima TaxID=126957 RepID=T1J3P8_STRMM